MIQKSKELDKRFEPKLLSNLRFINITTFRKVLFKRVIMEIQKGSITEMQNLNWFGAGFWITKRLGSVYLDLSNQSTLVMNAVYRGINNYPVIKGLEESIKDPYVKQSV